MRELHLIIPGLASWRASPLGAGVALPGLERLLKRGRHHGGATSLAHALSGAFGLTAGGLAPASAVYDGLDATTGYWLRADPVHLQIGMRGMTLLDADIVGLSREESAMLAASLAPLLHAAGWQWFTPMPTRWYVRAEVALDLHTTPLDWVATRHVDAELPTGHDAGQLMRLVNEAQILLHEHPVNQARERRGQPVINSLWLWGGGMAASAAQSYARIFATQAEALALARHSASPHAPCPARLADLPKAASTLLVLPEIPAHAQEEEVARLDADWLQPLLPALRLGRIRQARLTLTGPGGGSVALGMREAWRLW